MYGESSIFPAEHVAIFRKHQELKKCLIEGKPVFLGEMEKLARRARVCRTGSRITIGSIKRTWSARVRAVQSRRGRGIRWRRLDPGPTVFL